jgi:hypothetical protein
MNIVDRKEDFYYRTCSLDEYFLKYEKELEKEGITKAHLIKWTYDSSQKFYDEINGYCSSHKESNNDLLISVYLAIITPYYKNRDDVEKCVSQLEYLYENKDLNNINYLEDIFGGVSSKYERGGVIQNIFLTDEEEFSKYIQNGYKPEFFNDKRYGGLIPYCFFNKWYDLYEKLYNILVKLLDKYFISSLPLGLSLYNFLYQNDPKKCEKVKEIIIRERYSEINKKCPWEKTEEYVQNDKVVKVDNYFTLTDKFIKNKFK